MKSKRIAALALLVTLTIGGSKAFAEASNNTIQKNKLMIETACTQTNKEKNKEDKLKKVALDAFEKYLNEKVDVENLYLIRNHFYEAQGQKFYLVTWCDQNSKYINDKAVKYTALINDETNKIVHLEYSSGVPKNEDYKNFSYDKAETLATNFIKENNILKDKNYKFLEKDSKEVSLSEGSEGAWEYYFYFKYDGDKECLVTVNKELKKVNQFILLDETNAQG